MKKLINVTDIISYLYCPRKIYLKLVKGIKEPPNDKMILGFIKHKIFDIFSKNEEYIVSSIKEKITKEQLIELYKACLINIVNDSSIAYEKMMKSFGIEKDKLLLSILKFMKKEILLRADSVSSGIDLGFLGKELWRNLKPKYLTEFEIISENLGLKGRIDRVKVEENILPYEIKTRENIYESDKLQLAAYSLLLEEEFGKKISLGVVETEENQEQIEITEEMKAKVLEIAEKIRNMQDAEFPENFSKCQKCSLKNECYE